MKMNQLISTQAFPIPTSGFDPVMRTPTTWQSAGEPSVALLYLPQCLKVLLIHQATSQALLSVREPEVLPRVWPCCWQGPLTPRAAQLCGILLVSFAGLLCAAY